MFDVTNVTGYPGGTSFLVTTKESAFLCDTGFSFCAKETAKNIRAALDGIGMGSGEGGTGTANSSVDTDSADGNAGSNSGGAGLRGTGKLDYILLTHSHFDHAAGTPIIAREFPEAKVVASSHAAKVFTRPGARATIREMNMAAARDAGWDAGEDMTESLNVDIAVSDGDEIKSADETVRIYNTPGHTNCSITYHLENNDLLVTSESSGYLFCDILWPAFMTSYKDSLDAIALIKRLAPKYILLPHAGLISGKEAAEYPDIILAESEMKADFILSRHKSGTPSENIIADFIAEFYDTTISGTGLQTRESFSTNAEISIPRLIAESGL